MPEGEVKEARRALVEMTERAEWFQRTRMVERRLLIARWNKLEEAIQLGRYHQIAEESDEICKIENQLQHTQSDILKYSTLLLDLRGLSFQVELRAETQPHEMQVHALDTGMIRRDPVQIDMRTAGEKPGVAKEVFAPPQQQQQHEMEKNETMVVSVVRTGMVVVEVGWKNGERGEEVETGESKAQQAQVLLPPPLPAQPQQQLQSTATPPPCPPPPLAEFENEQCDSGRGCWDEKRWLGGLVVVRLNYEKFGYAQTWNVKASEEKQMGKDSVLERAGIGTSWGVTVVDAGRHRHLARESYPPFGPD